MTAKSLKDMQVRFGNALRAANAALPPGDGATDFAERFAVYQNNSWQFFLAALEQTYPVLRGRVGEDYFRTLVHEYREANPSRCGDLHWAGASFPAWLRQRLAETGYQWLEDLARLEWACAEASTTAQLPPLPLATLAAYPAEVLAELRLQWQPSLRLVASRFPIWTVWQGDPGAAATHPVDLAQGAEGCVVACVSDRPAVFRISTEDVELINRLQLGDTLGAALEATATDPDVLGRILAWAFAENLIVGIVSPSAPA